jgi:signal transduction histidine kinase
MSTSSRLLARQDRIMREWQARAEVEVSAALQQSSLALRDSLPEYLTQLADALSQKIDRTKARKKYDRSESKRVGRKHGRERAEMQSYTIEQLIFEYHILRQVIFDVMEEEAPLSNLEREIVICSVEQAVNDAASQFSATLRSMQDLLTNTLAHDMRGPLTAAKVSAQLIMRQPGNVELCGRTAKRIAKSMDRLDSMIHDLIDYNYLKAGIDLDLAECDLDLLAREVLEEATLTHGPRFLLRSAGSCEGTWEEKSLRRALENLVTNAVKYGEIQSLVTVSVVEEQEFAQLVVHNEGNPISRESQAMLFAPFNRGEVKPKQVGWGLGLAVVASAMEAHGGTVSVQSEQKTGTSFTLRLPKVPVQKSETSPPIMDAKLGSRATASAGLH